MKWHPRFTSCVGVCLVLASVLANAQETKQDKERAKQPRTPNYYPLEVGNRWHYRVVVEGHSAKAVSTIVKIEPRDGLPLARLEATIKDSKGDKDKVVAIEHLLQTKDGVFRHRMNDKQMSPPLKLLQYPIKAGAKWEGAIAVDKETGKYFCEATEEQVKVPAGTFKAVKVSIKLEAGENGATKTVRTTYWFVENKGFVKQTLKTDTLSMTMELEKFEPAQEKKKKEK